MDKQHGGKRLGAGRPPTDRKPITRQVTELEKQAIDNLLKRGLVLEQMIS